MATEKYLLKGIMPCKPMVNAIFKKTSQFTGLYLKSAERGYNLEHFEGILGVVEKIKKGFMEI